MSKVEAADKLADIVAMNEGCVDPLYVCMSDGLTMGTLRELKKLIDDLMAENERLVRTRIPFVPETESIQAMHLRVGLKEERMRDERETRDELAWHEKQEDERKASGVNVAVRAFLCSDMRAADAEAHTVRLQFTNREEWRAVIGYLMGNEEGT